MITILIAEDDDGHAHLIAKNFERVGIANPIVRVRDGQEALDYINAHVGSDQGEPSNTLLVLLDLNMPKFSGFEVLEHLKSNPATTLIPVIILSTTDAPHEIQRGYELGCNVYVTKPVEYDSFLEAIRRIGLFVQVIQLPTIKKKGGE